MNELNQPITPSTGPLASDFAALKGYNSQRLEYITQYSRLTLPGIMPSAWSYDKDQQVVNYQCVGSRGVVRLAGVMLRTYFGVPWMQTELPPTILYADDVDDEIKTKLSRDLFARDMTILALIRGSTTSTSKTRRNALPSGFMSSMNTVCMHLLVAGDACVMMDKDYGVHTFRHDNYFVQRDSSGGLLYTITVEHKDPLALSDDELASIDLSREKLKDEPASKRIMPLTRRSQYQPNSRKWLVTEEMNGKTLSERESNVDIYVVTPYMLWPGENHGRGLVEQNYGELAALDHNSWRMLQIADYVSKIIPVLDPSCSLTTKQFTELVNGQPIKDRVVGGQAQNIALLQANKNGDAALVMQNIARLEANLSKAFLLVSEASSSGDRMRTATAWRQVMREVDDALSGVGGTVADQLQRPLAMLAEQIAIDNGDIKKLPNQISGQTKILTGEAALASQNRVQSVLTVAQILQQMGPEAANRIDVGVLADVVAQAGGLYDEPGLIKSEKKLAAERRAAEASALRAAANQQAVQSVGNIAEQAAAASLQGTPGPYQAAGQSVV